ncbi:MAG: hypothetical protein QJR03_02050 [Sphaerobacter sp.]|nr:hypothetical protein [Sphaerobacter sp.]
MISIVPTMNVAAWLPYAIAGVAWCASALLVALGFRRLTPRPEAVPVRA